MKKKSLAKRIVSFITAVGLSLTSTVMLIPASAAVDEAHADCPGAGTVVWTETDTTHQLACNGDGCDYTEGESHTADYQWTVVNGTQHQLVCKGTGCTLVSGDAHDENTQIGICPLCEEQTEVYTVTVASVEGGTITAAYGDTAIAENGSAEVEEGTEITLTASPDDGFVFANWVINDEEGAADTSTTITVNEATTVSAVFTEETSNAYSININVTPEGAGEAWAEIDSAKVTEAEADSDVLLYHSSGSGYKFVEWRIDDVTVNTIEVESTDGGPSITHYFVMPAKNVEIEAVFELEDYNITVAGNKNGTVTVKETAKPGEEVTFTATPDSGYVIGEVKYSYLENAAEVATEITLTPDEDGSYSFEMPAYDVIISVTYTAPEYDINLTITPEGAGEVWATINSATVTEAEANSAVGLGYSSGSGYKFVEWRSDDVTVNALEVEPTGNGPSITHYFAMPEKNVNIEAVFEAIDYNITVGESENGSITIANLPAEVKAGDVVSFDESDVTADPDKGYALGGLYYSYEYNGEVVKNEVGYGYNHDSKSYQYYFTMPASDVTITAEFIPAYSITVGESENGSITIANLPEEAEEDDYIYINESDVTADPDKGYKLSGLCYSYVEDGEAHKATIDKYDSEGYYYFYMPAADITITATFVKVDYNVTVTSNDETMGTVGTDGNTANYGDKVYIYATPVSEDYELAEWRIVNGEAEIEEEPIESDDGDIITNYYFIMPAEDVEIKAVFKPVGSHLIDAAETEHGTVTVSGSAKEGDTVEFTAVPDIGYEISKVSISYFLGCSLISEELEGENGNYSFTMPAADVIITAEIKAVNYTVTVTEDEHGTVTVDKETANYQDTVTFTAVPDEGYEITEVKYSYHVYDAAEDTVITLTPDEEGNYSFEMPAYNVTITVTFKAIEYSVYTSENVVNGTVTRDKTKAIIGETVTFTARPDTSEYNYVVKDVKVTYTKNGVEETIIPTKGEDGKYSFTMPAADVYIAVEFAIYVFELYEDVEEDMVSLGFADTWEEIAELIEDGKYMIKVNKEYEFDTKFALPKTAEDLNFIGDGKLTFTGTKLVIPVDTAIQTEIAVSNKTGLIDITVAKDKSLFLMQMYEEYEIPVQFINKITGTKTSSFASGGASVTVNNIATFGEVLGNITVNGGKATGIAKLNGNFSIKGAKASAVITDIVLGSTIALFEENGVIPKVTIDNVVASAYAIADDEAPIQKINVAVANDYGVVDLAGGTTILYSKNKIEADIKVHNKTEGGRELTAYYYPKTKEIKAEDGTALTLYKGTEASDSTEVGSYPNFELLFAEITDKTADYIIEVNAPITLDSKFALPKTAKSLRFSYGTADGSLTFTGTKLIIPVNTTLEVKLFASNKTNLIDVSVAKDVTLNISPYSYPTDGNGFVPIINKLSGTKTSVLNGYAIANSIATFGEVYAYVLLHDGKATGIAKFDGQLIINGAKATAAITEMAAGASITLYEADGVIPKVTVDSVTADGDLTTIDVYVMDEGSKSAKLSSGTTVLYSKNDIADNVNILNTTSDGEEFTAYYYPKTKEIKAENGSALTLYKGVEKDKELVGSYKNFDELFAEITDSTVDYTIEVNTDITLGTKFAFPKKAKSIVLKGVIAEQEYPALIHTSTKLVIPYNVFFEGIDNVVSNKNNLIDISVAKGATFGCGEKSQFINPDGEVSINKITGTKTSHISGFVSANNISTFDTVEGMIAVYGKATGINKFGGLLMVTPEATADITEIANGSEIVLASKNGVIPKVTLGEIGEPVEKGITTVSVEIFDYETNEPVELASGTPVLYSNKADPDFTDKITIENNGGEMKAYAYGKTIKAEYGDAVTVDDLGTEGDAENANLEKDYPNFESAIAAINAAKNNTANYSITINKDIAPAKFELPKAAEAITLIGENVTVNVGKATAITANTDLYLGGITFVTTGKSLTLNAKKNLTVGTIYGDVSAIKGSAKFGLTWFGYEETEPFDITGFGTVKVLDTLKIGKNFNVTKLILGTSDGASTLLVSDVAAKASIKALDAANGGVIEYAEGAKIALAFTGKPADFVVGDGLTITGAVANGQAVLATDKIAVTELANGVIPENADVEYGFVKIGKNICYMGKVLEVTAGTEAEPTAYALWSEVVAVMNNASTEYTITLLDDYTENGAVKFPKAGTYKSVRITSDGEAKNFNFSGNLTLTANTTFEDVNIGAVKNGTPVKYTINAGKNNVFLFNCGTGLLTSVSGTAEVGLYNITAEKVKAGNLTMGGKIVAKGGITAVNVRPYSTGVELVMNQGSKLAVSGNIELAPPEDALGITATILNKTTGETAVLKDGEAIGTLKGTGAENITLNAEKHPGFKVELVKGKLVVKTVA